MRNKELNSTLGLYINKSKLSQGCTLKC